jgi:DNA processing protein
MDLEYSRCWLRLAQQPYPFINEFLNQIKAIDTDPNLLIDPWLKKNHCKINVRSLEKSLEWLQQPDHTLIAFPDYPDNLKAIKDPPAVLFLAGNPELLFHPQLAIVGSRKPTNAGRENAIYFATFLSKAGLTLISGLAIGIDALIHQAAIRSTGITTAVLGCGHNTCYPSKHHALFREIREKGLLISEFTPDTPVKSYQFPRRNRIISGLSLGVLVIEAAIKSGSLITCGLAAEQGRDVFAVPGDITNPMSRGCHHLIRQGAFLADRPEQILNELDYNPKQDDIVNAHSDEKSNKIYYHKLTNDEIKLLLCINRHATSVDSIVNRSGMKMALVLSVLFSLELKSMIIGSADGYFKRQLE